MNFCLSDLVPPLRWSDASTITLLTGQPDLPDAWWRTLPMPHVLAAIGPESLGELLTEIALEHWPAAAVGDVLPALHVLDPDEADEPAVAIALDRAGSWAGLLALTSRELVDQPFIQARPVLNTLFSAALVRLARSRHDHPAPAPASSPASASPSASVPGPVPAPASAAEAAATVGPVLAPAPAVPETAHGSEPVTADPQAAQPAGEHPAEAGHSPEPGRPVEPEHSAGAEHVGGQHSDAAEQPDGQHYVTGESAGGQQQAVEASERHGAVAEQAMPHEAGERPADAVAQFAAEPGEAARVADHDAEAAGSEVAAGPEAPAAGVGPDAEAVSAEQVPEPAAETVSPEPTPQPATETVSPEPVAEAAAGVVGPEPVAPGQDVLEVSSAPAAGLEPEPLADAAPEPEPQAHAAPEPEPQAHAVADAGVQGDVAAVPEPAGAAVSGHGQGLPELIEAAFAGLDDKSWAVAQNRIFTDEPSAVDQLAKLFAVPPAEIAATEDELRARLGQWLASDEAAPYRAHLDDLVRTLGPAAPKEQLIGAADWHQVEIRALEVPAWQFVLATLAPQP
ncbi:hypothetical protein FE391_25710, partial [Nonomuraea sp. KC401]